ncbi:MAG: reverse transcriptase family protein, partial [Cyanobacteria bacterium J06614_10]
LKDNKLMHELQSGFTEKRRTTDNLFILDYCIRESYKLKKELYVISVDLQKAFDSIQRSKLIETLMELNIDPNIIQIVSEIYTNDKTNLYLNNQLQTTVDVTSGIRQGCNGSTVFFLIITYIMIKELEIVNKGFKNEHFHIPALLYADDGLLLAHSKEDAETCISKFEEVASTCGLSLNKNKSSILIYNKRSAEDNIEEIQGIKLTRELTYLGIKVTNKKNAHFNEHIKDQIAKAKKLSNMTYSIIGTSCNRLLIGKTFWKGLAMPSYMYGSEIMCYTKADVQSFQTIENKVYRAILQLPTYTATPALRADIGASSCTARDMKNKILYAKHTIEDGHELLKEIFLKQYEENSTPWIKKLKEYLLTLNMSLRQLEELSKDKIKKKINEYDLTIWKEEVGEKTTLMLYKDHKKEINEINWYDNTEESRLISRGRSNTLELNWRKRLKNEDTSCPSCKKDEETIHHFILHCEAYQHIRINYNFVTQPYIENENKLIANILLFEKLNKEEIDQRKALVKKLWHQRKRILKGNTDN